MTHDEGRRPEPTPMLGARARRRLTPWTVISWSLAAAFDAATAAFIVACATGELPPDVLLRLLEALPSPVELRDPSSVR